MTGAGKLPLWPLATLLLAAAAWLLSPENQLNQLDQNYALLWGRELAHGELPDYDAGRVSTPHPLTILVAALLAPLGHARELLAALNLIAWSLIVSCAGLIGRRLLSPAAGALGAATVAVNAFLFHIVGESSADAFFAALLIAAVTFEVHRPRAGVPVLGLLALAGLSRPEAWLFAAAYALWLGPSSSARQRAGHAALVVSAPVLWAAMDAAVTGDPLYSLRHTQSGATSLSRPTGVSEIVPQLRSALTLLMDVPEAAGAAVGAALLAVHRVREAAVLGAVVALSVVGFGALGVAELPMLPRYLIVAAAIAVAVAGWSIVGWHVLQTPRLRYAFAAGGVLVLAILATRAPGRVEVWTAHADERRYWNGVLDDARRVTAASRGHACDVWAAREYKAVIAYELDRPPNTVRVLDDEGPIAGLVLVPVSDPLRDTYRAGGPEFMRAAREARTVATGRHFRLVDAGCR